MKKIWKFNLADTAWGFVEMPKGAEILSVQYQPKINQPMQKQEASYVLWAVVDPEAQKESRLIEAIGTGQEMKELSPEYSRKHLGTVQTHGGAFVLHFFEVIKFS